MEFFTTWIIKDAARHLRLEQNCVLKEYLLISRVMSIIEKD